MSGVSADRQRAERAGMGGLRADAVLGLPVRTHGIRLGYAVDLLVDLDASRALGLDVLCGDGGHRFLPLAAARVREDEIEIGSALILLDEAELAFYRSRAAALSALRGVELERGGEPVGRLLDVVVGERGELDAVLVGDGETLERVPGLDLRPVPVA